MCVIVVVVAQNEMINQLENLANHALNAIWIINMNAKNYGGQIRPFVGKKNSEFVQLIYRDR
jgi:hypothetical protein